MSPGDIIGNRYELQRLIGEGAMGSVWQAHDSRLNTLVAIKFLAVTSADFRERFRAEAHILARIESRRIVGIIDYDADHGPPYLVMRFVAGSSLDQLHPPLAPGVVRYLVHGMAEGLGAAHAVGAIHRDLKPSNIIVGENGEPTIIDFGLVTQSETGTLTAASMGTPEYWSPEQALGKELTDRTDVYALGVVAYELLTGSLPFPIAPGADRIAGNLVRGHVDAPQLRGRSDGDPALDTLVDDMLARDPQARPTARAVATRSEDGAYEPPPSTTPPVDRRSGPNRTPLLVAIGAGLVAVIIIAVVTITLIQGSSSTSAPAAATIATTTGSADTTAPTPPDTTSPPTANPGITGRFGSFDTIEQCQGTGDVVECWSSASGMLIRLSVKNGVGRLQTVDSRPWTGTTPALDMGLAVPSNPDSKIHCLSSRRGITCGFSPDIPYLGAGTDDDTTGTLTGCGPALKHEYFVIGDHYVRYCHNGVEKKISG